MQLGTRKIFTSLTLAQTYSCRFSVYNVNLNSPELFHKRSCETVAHLLRCGLYFRWTFLSSTWFSNYPSTSLAAWNFVQGPRDCCCTRRSKPPTPPPLHQLTPCWSLDLRVFYTSQQVPPARFFRFPKRTSSADSLRDRKWR